MTGTEGSAARAWREAMGWSRRELAERTGYSERAIRSFEAGEFVPGRPVSAESMQTYRLVCAAVALGVAFDWREARIRTGETEIVRRFAPQFPA